MALSLWLYPSMVHVRFYKQYYGLSQMGGRGELLIVITIALSISIGIFLRISGLSTSIPIGEKSISRLYAPDISPESSPYL